MGNAVKRRRRRDYARTLIDLAVVAKPLPGRDHDLALLGALLDLGRDDEEVAHHELVANGLPALAGEVVLHVAEHRLARLGALLGEFNITVGELHADPCGLADGVEIFALEHAPRSRRELHHRRERVSLGGADKELGVERRRRVRRKSHPAAAADHVGAHERMAEKTARNHVGNELLDRAPAVALVAETLDDRLTAHLEAAAIFVERELEADLGVGLAHLGRSDVALGDPFLLIGLGVARIELPAVDAILLLKPGELTGEPRRAKRIREVDRSGLAVPPLRGDRLAVGGIDDETALLALYARVLEAERHFAVAGRVHRDERTHPKHNLVAESVKLVAHLLGVGEATRIELPDSVAELPGVVDHDDAADGEAVLADRLGVGENILLVLVVRKLNPRIPLRLGDERQIGRLAARREVDLGRSEKRLAESVAGLAYGHRSFGLHDEIAVRGGALESLVGPDIAALAGDEKRNSLVGIVLCPYIAAEIAGLGIYGQLRSGGRRHTPPVFAWIYLNSFSFRSESSHSG